MESMNVRNFNLALSLESGQMFRYELIHGWYYLTIADKVVCMRQDHDKLYFFGTKGVNKRFIIQLFRLDEDYSQIIALIAKDKRMRAITGRLNGLRIMRQHPWECLASFICSSASNIPKIKMNVWTLSKVLGKRIILGDYVSYAFPPARLLTDVDVLKAAKLGFRAHYLHATAEMVDMTFFQKLSVLPYTEAKKQLMELPGVGSKIADCVLLFSLDFLEAFPVDVWVQRAMQRLYFKNRKTPLKKIEAFARDHFGSYAGYAQQFIYHAERVPSAFRP